MFMKIILSKIYIKRDIWNGNMWDVFNLMFLLTVAPCYDKKEHYLSLWDAMVDFMEGIMVYYM